MNLVEARLQLSYITVAFEQRFGNVVEYVEGDPSPSIAPNGLPYQTFALGYQGDDPAPLLAHVNGYLQCVSLRSEAPTLYWRTKLDIDQEDDRYMVYGRMIWDGKDGY